MSKLMELIDAYAQRRANNPAPYAAREARAAVVEAVEKLEKDAARMDWLDKDGNSSTFKVGGTWYVGGHRKPARKVPDVRAAIDAAMEATNDN